MGKLWLTDQEGTEGQVIMFPVQAGDVLGKASFESLPGCPGLGAGCAAVCASTSLCMAARLEAGRSLRCSRGGQCCASSAGLHALYDSLKVGVCALYDSIKGGGMLQAIAINRYEHRAFNY